MRKLIEDEIRQLLLFREAGGLTDEGEILYQRVIGGYLMYDDTKEITVSPEILERLIERDREFVRKRMNNPDPIDDLINNRGE